VTAPRNPRAAAATPEIAALQAPAPALAQVLAVIHGSMEAMDAFARVSAGVRSPTEFVTRVREMDNEILTRASAYFARENVLPK
jgi:hypothetical protein